MTQYKNIDLKIDLLLLNVSTEIFFIEKYKDNLNALIKRIRILIYLDDFIYIDEELKNKLLHLDKIFKEYNFDKYNGAIKEDVLEQGKKDISKLPRRKTAVLTYYHDLKEYITKNNIDYDRLSDIYESVRLMDVIYEKNKYSDVDRNSNKLLVFFSDVKYKIELHYIQNILQDLMYKKVKQKRKIN